MLFSCLPHHLADHFRAGRKYLVTSGRQVWIAGADAVFESRNGPTDAQFAVVDLEMLWDRFATIVGDKHELTQDDLISLCRVGTPILGSWRSAGFIDPINDVYDWQDAFAAVVCSVLYRRGLTYQKLKKVGLFIRFGEGVEAMK